MFSDASERAYRLSYQGLIHLQIPFTPWNLRIQLIGKDISTSGLLASIQLDETVEQISRDDLKTLLQINDHYTLQLDHDFEHLDSPVVTAQMVRRNFSNQELELAFKFDQSSEEVFALLHELKGIEQKESFEFRW